MLHVLIIKSNYVITALAVFYCGSVWAVQTWLGGIRIISAGRLHPKVNHSTPFSLPAVVVFAATTGSVTFCICNHSIVFAVLPPVLLTQSTVATVREMVFSTNLPMRLLHRASATHQATGHQKRQSVSQMGPAVSSVFVCMHACVTVWEEYSAKSVSVLFKPQSTFLVDPRKNSCCWGRAYWGIQNKWMSKYINK